MDPSDHSQRGAVWLIVALAMAYIVGSVGYEINWLHQRGVERAEISKNLTSSAVLWPTQSQNLPARGAGPLDKLAMWLSGEQKNSWFNTVNTGGDAVLATFANGRFPDDVLEGLDTVRHARWLFPEAEIGVVYFDYCDIANSGPSNPVTAWKAEKDRRLRGRPRLP